MSADLLREAAALIRKRAQAAEELYPAPSPWLVDALTPYTADVLDAEGDLVVGRRSPCLAEHIASWHPAVALLAAAVLEAEIPNAEYREQQQHRANETRLPTTKPFPPYYDKTSAAAIAFARQYLTPEVA